MRALPQAARYRSPRWRRSRSHCWSCTAAPARVGAPVALSALPHLPALAFCGLGNPGAFFGLLERLGADVRARRAFADHHGYTEGELQELLADAAAHGACALLTTHKDAVKLAALPPPELPVLVLHVRARLVRGGAELAALLERCLQQAPARPGAPARTVAAGAGPAAGEADR
ncbi:MAG: hypothetical protein KatS3mg102_0153 [Planctomycetota bacterium]|nr:MAG: hypothetical protein KatS3mg102_0153 [Planctomycetota bacterium]